MGRSATRILWAVAAVGFVLLLGATAYREAGGGAGGCSGPSHVEADAFAFDLLSAGAPDAARHLAAPAQPIGPHLPELKSARPAELERILAGVRSGGAPCRVLRTLLRKPDTSCFAYDLPARLAFDYEDAGRQTGFAVTVVCDGGRWRVNGFV